MEILNIRNPHYCISYYWNGFLFFFSFRREDPRDAVLLKSKHRGLTLETLPEQSIIGKLSLVIGLSNQISIYNAVELYYRHELTQKDCAVETKISSFGSKRYSREFANKAPET